MIVAKFTVVGHCADGSPRLFSAFENTAHGQEHILLDRVTRPDGTTTPVLSLTVQTHLIADRRCAVARLPDVGDDAAVEYLSVSIPSGMPLDSQVIWDQHRRQGSPRRCCARSRPARSILSIRA